MTVANILKGKRTAVFWVPPVLALGAAAERLRSAGVGVMIVSSDGESLLGLISERDIAHGLAAHAAYPAYPCHGRRKGCGRRQHRRRVEVEDFGGRA